jgi:integrase/recombinase XerD
MSALGQAVEDYLRLRRSLGHDLADAGRLLPRFVAYMDGLGAETITVETAVAWAQQPDAEPGTTVWPRRMTAVRGFARYMAGHDPCTEVPPTGLLVYRQRWRPPFIYTTGDIAALMTQALGSIPSPLRAATYETLVGLLASTGMRVGEAIRLDHADIDWSDGVLLIRESKFGKTRLVPVHGSTLRRPRRLHRPPRCPPAATSESQLLRLEQGDPSLLCRGLGNVPQPGQRRRGRDRFDSHTTPA